MRESENGVLVFGMMLVFMVAMLCLPCLVVAGDLEPSAAPADPAGAMYTLDDIYNRLNTGAPGTKRPGGFAEPAAAPGSTGRTLDEVMGTAPATDDANGASASEVAAGKTFWGLTGGEWGEQTGVGNCVVCNGTMNGTRWCDNGDGTVTDMTTGLIWLQNAFWGGQYAFWVNTIGGTNAHDRAAQLWDGSPHEGSANLSDGSVEGDWRLPTRTELYGLANGTEAVRSGSQRAFTGVQSYYYWSGTTNAGRTDYAWYVYLGYGNVSTDSKTGTYYVWPVRGGQ